MVVPIKAIETVYNGYRFRSRLEARWAVFFDALGIDYQYEKEGFELKAGRYLPDFWIPDWQRWIEIKPEMRWDRDVLLKCADLARATGYGVFLVFGTPWPEEYCVVKLKPDYACRLPAAEIAQFAECRRCDGICLQYYPDSGWGEIGTHTCGDHDKWPTSDANSAVLMDAFRAARQARFEHGERG